MNKNLKKLLEIIDELRKSFQGHFGNAMNYLEN